MADEKTGRFQPGVSGNRKGRPRKTVRRDGWLNASSGHGTSLDRRTLTRYGVDVVTDLEARQLWRSEWLCRKIIETLPGEANRRGWELKLEDKETAEAIEARAEELDVDGHMTRAAEFERAYGGAAIFPVIEGAQGELMTPLDPAHVTQITALHVFEPSELFPSSYYADISSPKFRHPEIYRFMPLSGGRVGYLAFQEIHESRLIIFPGRRVSAQTQPGQREGWGDSELNHARQMIADAGLTWGSVATLLHEFGQGVYAIDGLAEMFSQKGGSDAFEARMQAMDMFKSTMRSTAIDAKDSYTRMATPASGLDGLLAQQKEWIAAVAGMPVPILFGQQLGGMQSTGDAETRNWYAAVEKTDAIHYNPRRSKLIKLLLLETTGATGGIEPELWSIEPKPLWTPSEKETAEMRKIDAETDDLNIRNGIYSADEAAKSRYGGDTYGTMIVIDWKAREEQAKAADELQKAQAAHDAAALEAMGHAQPPPAQTPVRTDMIEHRGTKWVVLSHDGSKILGEYDTEDEAKKRLAQIEAYK